MKIEIFCAIITGINKEAGSRRKGEMKSFRIRFFKKTKIEDQEGGDPILCFSVRYVFNGNKTIAL